MTQTHVRGCPHRLIMVREKSRKEWRECIACGKKFRSQTTLEA